MTSYAYRADRPDAYMASCCATLLQREDLARSLPIAVGAGWLDRFNAALDQQTADAYLSRIPRELLPWRGSTDWIAGIRSRYRSPHVVVAHHEFVAFDPAGELQPGDPLPWVSDGFLILPRPRRLSQHRIEQPGATGDRPARVGVSTRLAAPIEVRA